MRYLFLLPLLLAGCAKPEMVYDRYFATVSFVKGTSEMVEIYVDACKTFPKAHPCYGKFPAINQAATISKAALQEASRAYVNKDKNAYATYTAADDAAMSMRNLLNE